MIHERASLRQRHIMQDMTTRIVPIEPQWFMQKAEVQSRTWRELNQGHIPQDIVDAITPAFALKLTRGHAADPNQVVLIALADDRVVGFIELLRTPRPRSIGPRPRNWRHCTCWNPSIATESAALWSKPDGRQSATTGSSCGSSVSTPTLRDSTDTSDSTRPD